MPWTFDDLMSSLTNAFSKATADYNLTKRTIESIERNTAQVRSEGVVTTAFQNVIVNRYRGFVNFSTLPEKAHDGLLWAYYFATCPHLEKDVRVAMVEWARSKELSVQGVMTFAATAYGTTPQDAGRLASAAKDRFKVQTQILAGTVAVGFGISKVLKSVGNYTRDQYLMNHRFAARAASVGIRGIVRPGWKITGVIAFLYGASKIADAMNETGAFSTALRTQRDAFNAGHVSNIKEMCKSVSIFR